MPGPTANKLSLRALLPRAGARLGLTATILLLGAQSLQNAVANGDTRTITMHHLHTKETITLTFKRDGRYDDAALKKLNWFLRDWRENKETEMDPRLIDLIWEVNREVGGTQPIQIICGYRDESTNKMLRRRSKGVAQNSLHMGGKAMDFAIPGVPLAKLRSAGLRLQRGGVGFYPSSGSPFVHMDVGGVRHWPRMTRDQLVRVFPNGRTVHIPSDGQPLAGYALALADIEGRGGAPSGMSLAAARNAGIDTDAATETTGAVGPRRPSLIASLFGADDDTHEADETKPAAAPAPVRVAAAPRAIPTAPVPLPKGRPAAAPIVVAMALPDARPAAEPKPDMASPKTGPGAKQAALVASASPSPSDIIRMRGYWVGVPDMKAAATSTLESRMAALAPDATTGSIPPAWQPPSTAAVDDQRLAYAPQPEPHAVVAPRPRRSVIIRSADAATSVALKARVGPVMLPVQAFNPWLTAVAITPSVWSYLSSTQYGVRDFRSLRQYLDKPATTVAMTFTHDSLGGLNASRFGGPAVVFVGTVTFAAKTVDAPHRTASLAFTAAP